jgi:thymidylate synthase ThyX
MYDALQANWGDAPSRTVEQHGLTRPQIEYLDRCFSGRTLPQVLEGLTFWFTIDGVSRATTHQIVRSRMGAAFMQHGGRDNDWRHRGWTMPETIARASEGLQRDRRHCITDWTPINKLLQCSTTEHESSNELLQWVIEDYLDQGKKIYAALVDAGIPWQDARRLLPIGTQTYIHAIYNYSALRGVLANRLEHTMDWEINCVAQLMLRELHIHCPEGIWEHLGSHSDLAGRSTIHEMASWAPDQKHPLPDDWVIEGYAHAPEQNPFWVLTPEAMAGGPVAWIPTDGTHPNAKLRETGEK